jgi:hypothetical protein
MQSLTGKELERLTKLCGLFSSHHPAEVAEAARKADQFLRERGLRWPDVLRLPGLPASNGNGWDEPTEADEPFAEFGGWQHACAFAIKHQRHLTPWERAFVQKISSWFSISEKQRPILRGVVDKVMAAGYQP